jgi:hypothetical protein
MANNPDLALREFIEDYFGSSYTDLYPRADGVEQICNPAWYEKSRSAYRQVWMATKDREYISVAFRQYLEMGIEESPILDTSIRHVYVGAPTQSKKEAMKSRMLQILDPKYTDPDDEDVHPCLNYVASDGTIVNQFLLNRFYPIDKDTKYGQYAWAEVFEIYIHW